MLSSLRSDQDQTYRLRWNNDSSAELNLSEAFRDLRECSEFFDVSLGCTVTSGGSKSIRAHKILLSAYSPAFKEMFREHSNRLDPFIFLKGVSYLELSNLLDFMYNGEVNVKKSNLSDFLALAEELQIKGLAKENNVLNKRQNLLSSQIPKPRITTGRYETLSKYLKKENPFDLSDDNLASEGTENKQKEEKLNERFSSKYISKPRRDSLREDDGDDDNNVAVSEGEVGVVEDFIKNLNKHLMSGNQKRTVARCRICLRELRRDKIKTHIRGSHSSYLVSVPKEEPVTSSNGIEETLYNNDGMEENIEDFQDDSNQDLEESFLDSQ